MANCYWVLRTYWKGDKDPWGWYVTEISSTWRKTSPNRKKALRWRTREDALLNASWDGFERAYFVDPELE